METVPNANFVTSQAGYGGRQLTNRAAYRVNVPVCDLTDAAENDFLKCWKRCLSTSVKIQYILTNAQF